ncbi:MULTISPECIES: VOC family protein [unclassified Haladaptatus]|uniref:VOC family protein n=1 Tax=unclassified Haladaptatus TaxID=2622732 RepID=UPI00209C0485|nr:MULTISPECIES: VOC family protein [unclassified Haladaptatus]MCO8245412.1 VOC family protein [Haladaptatus sp. AB643]MCO8256845.1 VOC family protein [Haladaptatus sp. AB618]
MTSNTETENAVESRQKITPNLWFDDQAVEAAEFYTSVFENAEIKDTTHYPDAGQEITGREAGSVMTVAFQVEGFTFVALNGGPEFSFNPSISFFVSRETKEEIDELWEQLVDGGAVLIQLDEYPFSDYYGWVQDRYGVTWQLILPGNEGDWRPDLMPSLMFTQDNVNKAEEAVDFYTDVFADTELGHLERYPEDTGPAKKGALAYGDFKAEDVWLAVMDTGVEQDFAFNEAISLIVNCDTQDEIDELWDALSAVPEAEQCGWLKDKYGVSWQITPTMLNELPDDDSEASARMMEALLEMKKLDITELQSAYDGN